MALASKSQVLGTSADSALYGQVGPNHFASAGSVVNVSLIVRGLRFQQAFLHVVCPSVAGATERGFVSGSPLDSSGVIYQSSCSSARCFRIQKPLGKWVILGPTHFPLLDERRDSSRLDRIKPELYARPFCSTQIKTPSSRKRSRIMIRLFQANAMLKSIHY